LEQPIEVHVAQVAGYYLATYINVPTSVYIPYIGRYALDVIGIFVITVQAEWFVWKNS
jgi:hypothetical protein